MYAMDYDGMHAMNVRMNKAPYIATPHRTVSSHTTNVRPIHYIWILIKRKLQNQNQNTWNASKEQQNRCTAAVRATANGPCDCAVVVYRYF